MAHDLHAVDAGKQPVQDGQIEGFGQSRVARRTPVIETLHHMAERGQAANDLRGGITIVFGKQDSHPPGFRDRSGRVNAQDVEGARYGVRLGAADRRQGACDGEPDQTGPRIQRTGPGSHLRPDRALMRDRGPLSRQHVEHPVLACRKQG
ncbi:hypothetical protein WR25_00349 [Diploscapter pachys]|uniref:Uncharacterized protein n=1 Tax=Diploscapter pachys TaxID=2018661 RepID=A0A2A2JZF9_9BILA|nr:hypothetical protein WR25_00349 [Diploscapter pachys]